MQLYADLTNTNPATYPHVPTPFGDEAADVESADAFTEEKRAAFQKSVVESLKVDEAKDAALLAVQRLQDSCSVNPAPVEDDEIVNSMLPGPAVIDAEVKPPKPALESEAEELSEKLMNTRPSFDKARVMAI